MMKRKQFLKKLTAGAGGIIALGAVTTDATAAPGERRAQIGFNHLPNKEERTMKTIIHRAATRGHANHGWLDSHHTFSFANYNNTERTRFGVLRVLNDDVIDGGTGFGRHPHDNMEIISIPIEGALEHKDSMGNSTVIAEGEIQAMSAGTGVFHSEFNHYKDRHAKFLQIWLFPKQRNITPRYDQKKFDEAGRRNAFQTVVAPVTEGGNAVKIVQDAWFSLADLDEGRSLTYKVNKPENGLYLFLIEGSIIVAGTRLDRRDSMGITDTAQVTVSAAAASKLMMMEVPMSV
jgi:redox-sensitive bicupin YhaK (pirin superfamily)